MNDKKVGKPLKSWKVPLVLFRIVIMPMGLCVALVAIFSCGPNYGAGRPVPYKIPRWSQDEAVEAVEAMVKEYRAKGEEFWKERAYVWTGSTWIWPETAGVKAKHIKTLETLFYKGDDATSEIVLCVILMNIPARELEKGDASFLADLVKMDTDLKERRANAPPPTPYQAVEKVENVAPPSLAAFVST